MATNDNDAEEIAVDELSGGETPKKTNPQSFIEHLTASSPEVHPPSAQTQPKFKFKINTPDKNKKPVQMKQLKSIYD